MTLWMKLIESKEEGRSEGRSEGQAEELARIAGLMLSDGMSEEKAAATLHISEDELRQITAKNRQRTAVLP